MLSRDDLCLDWRPLHALYQRVFYSKYTALGLKIYPQCVGCLTSHIYVKCLTKFFPHRRTCSAVQSLIHHVRK